MNKNNHAPTWVKNFYDQAAAWWGDSNRSDESLKKYSDILKKMTEAENPLKVLDLGAGNGAISEFLALEGHEVTAIEISPKRTDMIRKRAERVLEKTGIEKLKVVEGDFLSISIGGPYDVICCFEVFGIGSDDDQKKLLTRISNEWIDESGCAIIEVYSPIGPIKFANTARELKALKGVPGSVDMINTCGYDPVHSLWIDEWKPVDEPHNALSQCLRCYSPADMKLLLYGTDLTMSAAEYHNKSLDISNELQRSGNSLSIANSHDFMFDCSNDYAWTAKLVKNKSR